MLTINIIQNNTHKLFMGIVLFLTSNLKAQTNLVPNPSFEQYTICPNNTTISGVHNSKPDDWNKPDVRNAVYFNICQNLPPHLGIPYNGFGGKFSYQYPRTGDAYVGLSYLNSGYQNYIQTQLFDSCKKGRKYYAEYDVNLSNASKYGCNNIGMLFTKNAVYADTVNQNLLLANPQILNYGNPIVTDTMGWVKISGIFTAQGGEQYLTLGNFKSESNTQTKIVTPTGYGGSAYYVDDVAVYGLDSFCLKASAGKDTAITVGDSVFIGSYTNGIDSIKWLNGNNVIDSIRPGFWVHPTATTSYILQQVVNGCFSADTVVVTVGTVPLKFISYTLVSSLRGTEQSIENIWQTANEINVSHFYIQRSLNGKDFTAIGKVKAQNKLTNEYSLTDETPNEGLNYYKIESVDFDGRKQYSETRILNFKPQTLNGISIFPNPAKDFVTIESKDIIKQIKVINQVGQIVYSNTINRTSYILNLTLFSNGLYIVQTTKTNGETSTQKLTINN